MLMRAVDFNFSKELSFDFEQGITHFRDNRLLIIDANALGLLRQNMLDALGLEKTRAFFFRLGYQQGYSDLMHTRMAYEFTDEVELLKIGPVMNTWEGKVKSETVALHYDRAQNEFHYQGVWRNSYEAEQHLSYNDLASSSVCWVSMGYASGWSTGFFGSQVICMEQSCVGMGDEVCRTLIQSPEKWGVAAEPYLAAIQDL